jgi:hypothetical protein
VCKEGNRYVKVEKVTVFLRSSGDHWV